MIELVEKLGYDVESTTKFISEHNEKVLKYWTSGLETFLLLIAIIVGYFIYKKVSDGIICGYLFMLVITFCVLAWVSIPKYVFKPLLTEEKQIVQKNIKTLRIKILSLVNMKLNLVKTKNTWY